MIYKVHAFNANPVYFDESTNPNALSDAEALLVENRAYALTHEATRFSICAEFTDGNNITWREIREADPENTICQVFDSFTGTYIKTETKSEAYTLNENMKQKFLEHISLDKIFEVTDDSGDNTSQIQITEI
jgi:hypothetical protein